MSEPIFTGGQPLATYRVFTRRPYTGSKSTGFRPNGDARKRTLRTGLTIEEARGLCSQGPANTARDEGREYRHLSFYEFEKE